MKRETCAPSEPRLSPGPSPFERHRPADHRPRAKAIFKKISLERVRRGKPAVARPLFGPSADRYDKSLRRQKWPVERTFFRRCAGATLDACRKRITPTSKSTATRWPCCRCGPPSRTTCTCPTAPTCSRGRPSARRFARRPTQRGAKVVLLPTIPYGTETNQMAFPLAMNLNPSTLFAVITDLVESLAHHGIRKFVLLNSHGGNDLKAAAARAVRQDAGARVLVQLVQRAAPTWSARSSTHPGRSRRRNGNLVRPGLFSGAGRPQRRRHACWPTRGAWPRRGSRPSTAAGSRSPGPGTC